MNRILLLLVSTVLISCSLQPKPDMDALANRIDRMVAEHDGATVAVAVRDPSKGVSLNREQDRLFHAASTMKVPVMIELYRQMELGRFGIYDSLEVRNQFRSIVDGSPYAIEDDSDDDIYGRLGSMMSLGDLIDRMIVVSSNLATNLLIEFAGADSVQATSERLGTRNMLTLRGVEDLKAYEQGLSNRTSAHDLALLLEALMQGTAVSARADAAMIDIMRGQTMGEMIPSGLPAGASAAHKTGQITEIHHDAGIVYPASGEPFVLVILIEGIADDSISADLGARITAAVYESLRSPRD